MSFLLNFMINVIRSFVLGDEQWGVDGNDEHDKTWQDVHIKVASKRVTYDALLPLVLNRRVDGSGEMGGGNFSAGAPK